MPYMFVEGAVLLKHDSAGVARGPKAGKERVLDLLPAKPVVSKMYKEGTDRAGYHLAPRLAVPWRDVDLRGSGIFYMVSGPFGRTNATDFRIRNRTGRPTDLILCRDSDDDSLASLHWLRPHCPVPVAGECKALADPHFLDITTNRRGGIPTDPDAKVSLSVGEPRQVDSSIDVNTKMYQRVNVNGAYRVRVNSAEATMEEEWFAEMADTMYAESPSRLNIPTTTPTSAVRHDLDDPGEAGVELEPDARTPGPLPTLTVRDENVTADTPSDEPQTAPQEIGSVEVQTGESAEV
jgi:hypothetical protein